MRTMHLFAGAGGGLLADLILGHTPVVAVEWEPYACQVLRERAADGWFPGLRVWEGDVRLFDPSEYAGSVDCIHAGFPCQDISVAGKQAGVGTETRSGLYREVLRIAGVVRPRYLFLENVAAIVSNGLGTVLSDLAALGYESEWLCLRASDCGANHQRDRWWLLARMADADSRNAERGQVERPGIRQPQSGEGTNDNAGGSSSTGFHVADTNGFSAGRIAAMDEDEKERTFARAKSGRRRADVADTHGAQRQGMRGTFGIGAQHADTSSAGWWEAEPGVCRVADGVPARVHRLKALGNAQVPLQAATAWRLLGGE